MDRTACESSTVYTLWGSIDYQDKDEAKTTFVGPFLARLAEKHYLCRAFIEYTQLKQ